MGQLRIIISINNYQLVSLRIVGVVAIITIAVIYASHWNTYASRAFRIIGGLIGTPSTTLSISNCATVIFAGCAPASYVITSPAAARASSSPSAASVTVSSSSRV